jgi:hypothetical protein
MLTTTGFRNFGFEFNDSTVLVLPGAVRLGNTVYGFDGTQTHLNSLGLFQGDTSSYQNVILYLTDASGAVDMTRVVSEPVATKRELEAPVMGGDRSSQPLGMLTLYSSDGTQANLVSYLEL